MGHLVIGALALDRPVWLEESLQSGGRLRGRTLSGSFAGRLGGGGANAAVALARAGRAVRLAASIADDADGKAVRALAEAEGLDLSLCCTRPGASGRTLILIEPGGERVVLGLDDPKTDRRVVGPAEVRGWRPKGLFIRAAYVGAAQWAEACEGPVLLHWPSSGYAGGCDVVVASRADLADDVRAAPFETAAARLGPRLQWVVVTDGAAGAVAYAADRRITMPAPRAEVRDATGAGDVFAAGLLDALAAGADMAPALAHACRWGATAVQFEGSAPTQAPADAFAPFVSGDVS